MATPMPIYTRLHVSGKKDPITLPWTAPTLTGHHVTPFLSAVTLHQVSSESASRLLLVVVVNSQPGKLRSIATGAQILTGSGNSA